MWEFFVLEFSTQDNTMIVPPIFSLVRLIATKEAVEDGANSENLCASACFTIAACIDAFRFV